MVLGVSCHPKRDMLASGGLDKDLRNIRIWEMQDGVANANPNPHPHPNPHPNPNPNPNPNSNPNIRIWEMQDGVAAA